jgi:hypothetical protein
MSTARENPTATLLKDGTVLVVGGYSVDSNREPLASAEIYDPATGAFSPTGPMAIGRRNHTATLLEDGRVLVAGGYNGIDGNTDGSGNVNAPEIYDPVKRTFSATGDMLSARRYPSATMLPNGKVLIAGGYGGGNTVLSSADVYDPTAGTFAATGAMLTPRGRHTATDMMNGTVLIAGGYDDKGNTIASAELYDSAKGTFSPTGSMATARWRHAETRLLNGDVLITGGSDGTTAVDTAELYNVPAGVIWLQRDGAGNASWFARLATELARQTKSIVVAPKFRRLDKPGKSVNGDALARAVADLFLDEADTGISKVGGGGGGDRLALNSSAAAAGHQGQLPKRFLFVGIGKGGGFATSAGACTVDNGAAIDLLGVVMLNGVAKKDQFPASLAKLGGVGVPFYQIAGPGYGFASARGRTTRLLKQLYPDQFVGIQIWPGATDAVTTTSVGWINDMYAGRGPDHPLFGIYGNPNDGSYIPGQQIMINLRKAKVL